MGLKNFSVNYVFLQYKKKLSGNNDIDKILAAGRLFYAYK